MKFDIQKQLKKLFSYTHENIMHLNQSKLFAGLIIITLNISSKFVNIRVSKTMESYLKNTFSKAVLVFAMAWMGTRDIYTAIIITFVFILCIDHLLNENSSFCCMPKGFRDYHLTLLENEVTEDDVKKAKEVLEKAEKQKSIPAMPTELPKTA
jgi:hypothetical protein